MCDVCLAYLRLSFRIYGVCVSMAYVCATYVSLLWSMCDVQFIRSIRNILWRSKRILMFSFLRSHDQIFLTVRGAVQGSFRATLGIASVFVHVFLRTG